MILQKKKNKSLKNTKKRRDKMSKFLPKDEILSIKSVDLFTYLKTCFPSELQLFCNGTYTTKTHSSLKISNGLWHYFKEGIGGKNAVDYLVKVENYDFLSACNKVKNDKK